MSDLLNIRTLIFISGIISLTLSICMLYVSRTRKTYNGFRQWTIASILYMLGQVLSCMRSILPDFISVIVANTLLVAGTGFVAYGLELFTDSTRKIWLYVSFTLSMVLAFLFFTYYHPDVNARIVIISTIITIYYAYSVYLVCRYVPPLVNDHNRFLEVVFSIQAAWLVLRIAHTVFLESPTADFMQASAFQGTTVIVFFSGNILIVIGLIVLNFQRVEIDWSTAMAEVKTLRGLIPICSSCKKIRDDRGIWSQIEIYIRKHSDVKFSHGICPECMQKLYPEVARDMDR